MKDWIVSLVKHNCNIPHVCTLFIVVLTTNAAGSSFTARVAYTCVLCVNTSFVKENEFDKMIIDKMLICLMRCYFELLIFSWFSPLLGSSNSFLKCIELKKNFLFYNFCFVFSFHGFAIFMYVCCYFWF